MDKMKLEKIFNTEMDFDSALVFDSHYEAFKFFVNNMVEEFREEFMDLQLPERMKIKLIIEG